MLGLRAIRSQIMDRPRLQRLIHGSLSALAGKGTAFLGSLVTLPIMIRYLGPVRYGIWVTISTTILMLGVLDLGIASTLTNQIAKANASDNKELARNYFTTALSVTLGIAFVLGCLAWLLWGHIPWGSLFGVNEAGLARQAGLCVAVAILFFLLNLPLNLASRVVGGYQQIQNANYFAMLGTALSIGAILTGVWMHLSLPALMVVFCCPVLFSNFLLNLWLIFYSRPWLRPGVQAIRPELLGDLFGEGTRFFVLQLSGLIVFNSDNLVISHYMGAAQVTPYSVTGRLMSTALTMHTLLTPVLWPAFSDAFFRGDLIWIRRAYHRTATFTVAGMCVLALCFGLFGRVIIRYWATPSAMPSPALLWVMAAWTVILAISTNQACLLAATQRIGLQAMTSSVAAICNLAASIWLVRYYGSVGVVLASIASYLIFILAPQGWEVRNVLKGRYSSLAHMVQPG